MDNVGIAMLVGPVALKRMDNVGIVVDNLSAAIEFFRELGLELEGRAIVEGEWARRVTGLGDQRVEIAMMRTPDGHSRLELSRFLAPPVVADHRNAARSVTRIAGCGVLIPGTYTSPICAQRRARALGSSRRNTYSRISCPAPYSGRVGSRRRSPQAPISRTGPR